MTEAVPQADPSLGTAASAWWTIGARVSSTLVRAGLAEGEGGDSEQDRGCGDDAAIGVALAEDVVPSRTPMRMLVSRASAT